MKKRLVSILLTVAMCMGLAVPAFAAEESLSSGKNDSILNADELYTEYSYDEGEIVYAKICYRNNIVERFNDAVYLNGEKEMTVHTSSITNYSTNVEPRTGWIASESCPPGEDKFYTTLLYSDKTKNLEFEKSIISYSTEALALLIAAICPPIALASQTAALAIRVVSELAYSTSKTLYYTETMYGYAGLSNYMRKSERTYYVDSNHTTKVNDEILYWAWG